VKRARPEVRDEIREAVQRSIDEHLARSPKLRGDLPKLFALVVQSFPFGPRKGERWRRWTKETRDARLALAALPVGGEHIDRPCPTCRARPGKPCRSVGDGDVLNPEFMIASGQAPQLRGNKAPGRLSRTQKADVMHAARRDLNAPITGVVTDA
jgi:hypothetical protein